MASQHLDNLLSTLSAEASQHWKSIKSSNKRHQRKLAGLLRLKAFQGDRFTDTETYQRGKKQLAVTRQLQFRGNAEAKVQRFRQLMGVNSGPKHIYLDREALNADEVKAAFREFKRPFGECDGIVYQTDMSLQKKLSICSSPRRALCPPATDTTRYIVKRMQDLLRCKTLSKETMIRLSASEVLSPKSVSQLTSPTMKAGKRRQEGKMRSFDAAVGWADAGRF